VLYVGKTALMYRYRLTEYRYKINITFSVIAEETEFLLD